MKFFLKLLDKQDSNYTAETLYQELMRSSPSPTRARFNFGFRKKPSISEIGGLGKYFKQQGRIQLVKDAFEINDVTKTATIRDIEALQSLAKLLLQGEKSMGITKSQEKVTLCYALICQSYEAQGKYQDAINILWDLGQLYRDDRGINTVINGKRQAIEQVIEDKKMREEAENSKRIEKENQLKKEQEDKDKENENEAKEKADRPQQDRDTVQLMLTTMASVTVTGTGTTLQKKKAQEKYFNAEIKNLTLDQLGYLLERMIRVQNNTMTKGEEKPFEVIRTERWSLFGGGNTDTWQAMVSAVKLQLMIKLSQDKITDLIVRLKSGAVKKVEEKDKELIHTLDFDKAERLLGQHAGRFYARWGSTSSSAIFNRSFKTVDTDPSNPPTPATRFM